jgi:glycosyltransferase involved in cell wall biosynthesis
MIRLPSNEFDDAAEGVQSAEDALRHGNPILAIDILKVLPKDHPFRAKADHIYGKALHQEGKSQEALIHLVAAARNGEKSPTLPADLGAIAMAARKLDDAMFDEILALITLHHQPENAFQVINLLLEEIGFTALNSFKKKTLIFDRLVLPLMQWAAETDSLDLLLRLEAVSYVHYVRQRETEEHFRTCFQKMLPLMISAGERQRHQLPAMKSRQNKSPARIGFFLHNASILAHVEVMINMIAGYRRGGESSLDFRVYCFEGSSLEMEAKLADLNVPLTILNQRFPETEERPWARLLAMRNLLNEEEVHAITWISLAVFMPLAFSAGMAPVQIWWAMKYHSLELEAIDGYVTGGGITRTRLVGGRVWRNGVLGSKDWYDEKLQGEAAALRMLAPDKIILATLGRIEKLLDPTYLESICALLRRNPEAIFLWTGRHYEPSIQNTFEEAGIASQTQFIGWVNTQLYAQVIDIFLDSFPLPCGFTLFQAMAAGKPVVIMTTPEAGMTGLWALIGPLLEDAAGTPEERAELKEVIGFPDRMGIGIAHSPDEYIELASNFIQNSNSRANAGSASRALIKRYFSDPGEMARSYAAHFHEIIGTRYPNTIPS